MSYAKIRVSRNELYTQVWAQPVSVVAKSYGISDVGLAKICKRLAIPIPPLGYWAKKQHGKAVEQPPLPPPPPDTRLEITIHPRRPVSPDSDQLAQATDLVDAEHLDDNQIQVLDALTDPHPHVVAAQKLLRKAKKSEHGLLRPPESPCLDICVSPAMLDRALRVMDALFKAFAERGFAVTVEGGEHPRTKVEVLGEWLIIDMCEELTKVERPISEKRRKELEKHTWMRHKPEYDYFPSGKLSLTVHANVWNGMRRRWGDTVRGRLETSLNVFVIGLVKVAVTVRAERLEKERRDREWEEKQRRVDEQARRKKEEREKLDRLHSAAAAWHKSQKLRAYIAAVRQSAIDKHGVIEPESDLGRWLAWAVEQADRLDPLTPSPPSVLDEPDLKLWSWDPDPSPMPTPQQPGLASPSDTIPR